MRRYLRKIYFIVFFTLCYLQSFTQITVNINSGNPKYPFPQFLGYTGAPNTLANYNPVGVPHAELEQRTRDAYQILTNNMTYNVNKGGTSAPVTVGTTKYIMPNAPANGTLCTCAEQDGYYLLAAAYMADKTTFDGYYMWVHDREFQKTARYIDGVVNSPTYAYSPGIAGAGNAGTSTNVLGGGLSGNSAGDGDEDIAMALLVAWQQWGDLGRIGGTTTTDFTGNPIYYKTEAIKYIKTMVDTLLYTPSLPVKKYLSGDIGLDGYQKGGDSWAEETNWANAGAWMGLQPEQVGANTNYVDYLAPSYHRVFADMLTTQGESAWCINQYRRGEASGDWLIGQAYAQGDIPFAGQYSVTGTTPTFVYNNNSEDFRLGWRTILNYVWQGAPTRTWNATTHNYATATNTYERDMANRFAGFLKNPQGAPYNNTGDIVTNGNGLQYCGTESITWHNNPQGTADNSGAGFELNWLLGTGSPAAVVSGDTGLMALLFRELVIKWDQAGVIAPGAAGSQQYLQSMPTYFHEWFRLLGMLVLTGNLHNPLDFSSATANMKVYKAVNKTYAHKGDTITYTISYRNYSSVTASSVVVTDPIPSGLTFLSATAPTRGGSFSSSGGTITWNVGTVPGFVTGGLAATMDSVTLKVIVTATAAERVCNVATISCSNGSGWTSNEYPNNQTATMQRNCVDILTDNPIALSKTGSRSTVEVGDTLIYTIKIKNQSVAFLNGGRQGVVVSAGNGGLGASAGALELKYRIYHGAEEPLINYQNYRVSYYLNKPGPPTWIPTYTINEGVTTTPTANQQTLTPGATWNHRFLLTFPNQLATTTFWLTVQFGNAVQVHQGSLQAQRLAFMINDAAYTNYNWTNDWSSEPGITAADGALYFPVANDWTDPLNPNQPVLKYDPGNCSNNVTTTSTKQLVEEWDGYTWRRIYGNAPVSGRDLYNVKVIDTVPAGVTFKQFMTGYPTGTVATSGGYTIITWPTIADMKVNDSSIYKYEAVLNSSTYFNCPNPSPSSVTNKAYASATGEQLTVSSVNTAISCTTVPNLSPSVTKTADKSAYSAGDNITYTVTYQNLTGTIVSGTTVQANWVAIPAIGSALTVTAGTINLNTSNTNEGMYYQYSHGTNGTVKGTFTLANYQNTYAIILRYNGTTWTEVRFNVQGANGAYISVYNMPANTQIGATQTIPYSNAPNAFDFELQLVNGSLNVWVVNSGTIMSSFPAVSFTGLTVQAGYAGVKSTPAGAATLANWYTQLDSDFNLQMADPIPTGITYTSATSATYNATTYTGSHTSTSPDTVKWQTIAGPVLANATITYKWTGKVTSCSSAKILNIAYANVMGLSPSPAGEVSVTCNSVTPVTLIDFTAAPQNSDVLLQWSTSAEVNNNYFVVERSYNGTNFNAIGQVKGSENSSVIKYYSFTDTSVYNSPAYYRLVQVDNNGSSSNSKVVSVSLLNVESKILLYPNPYTHQTTLRVSSSQHEKISVKIITVTGVELYSNSYYTNENITLGNGLPDGVYMLQVLTPENVSTLRLVKSE